MDNHFRPLQDVNQSCLFNVQLEEGKIMLRTFEKSAKMNVFLIRHYMPLPQAFSRSEYIGKAD